MEKELSKELPNDTSFVYFPLGVDMERNLLISAPFYTNQVEIIRHIAKALPIVKRGPKQKKIVNSPKPFLADSLSGFAV